QKRQRDRPFEHRREVAARDLAGRLAVDDDDVALASRLAPGQGEASEATGNSPLALTLERGASPELAFVPADDPAEPRLQRRNARAQLVAVQREPRLEPQGVASAKARGLDAAGNHARPERLRDLAGERALHAVLPRVAGAGDATRLPFIDER